MKFIAILLTTMLALACSRNVEKHDECYALLTGKWKFIQYYTNIGSGPNSMQPAPVNQTYIQFNANGTVSSDIEGFSNFTHYQVPNDSSLVFVAPAGDYTMFFKIKEGTLEINPLCVEGCGYQFKKQ